jgi:DNA replication and repair protein RecF
MSVAVPALLCHRLRLRNYRNFPELELTFPADGVAIIGDNGAGKTNLLESIYYLEIFRSFRGAPDEQLVRFGEDAFHIRGSFEEPGTGRSFEITAAWEARTRTKRVTIDGVEPDRIGDAIGRVRAIIFSPADMSIVSGGPAERRRFLDIVLSVNEPGYLAALQRYRNVLRQRNALLRAGSPAALVEAWSAPFIEAGAAIVSARARWVQAHAEGFARRYRDVSNGAMARLGYLAGLKLGDTDAGEQDALRSRFVAELDRVAARERDRGVTMIGPHRDDLLIETQTAEGDVGLRDFGSGGQLRTAAIALRMIEAETAREARGTLPLVLLDDVFAELDADRSRRILEMLETEGHGQVILTAPKSSDVDLRRTDGAASIASLRRWRIAAGCVMETV